MQEVEASGTSVTLGSSLPAAMATLRKMHADIDRTLKLVASGIEEFDRTWEKVYARDGGGQKEKYESDLKKEIK